MILENSNAEDIQITNFSAPGAGETTARVLNQTYGDTGSNITLGSISSNNSAIDVKVNNQAEAKAFNAQIAVSSLAQAQTLEFSGFSSKREAINLGISKSYDYKEYTKLGIYCEENDEIDILNSFKDFLKFQRNEFNDKEKLVIQKYMILFLDNFQNQHHVFEDFLYKFELQDHIRDILSMLTNFALKYTI